MAAGVLIESDWNLKEAKDRQWSARRQCINRIRLEFKDERIYQNITDMGYAY